MREVVVDTETTGLNSALGDRIIEIGAVELINHLPSGKTWHRYLSPDREISPDAVAIHGLTNAFLEDKPRFSEIAQEFLDFLADSPIIIHNAAFDLGFLNAELSALKRAPIYPERVIDTLVIARKKHPMGPNSLDALCRRYGVDNTGRTKHGALIDCHLLAAVYIELIDARQPGLVLAQKPGNSPVPSGSAIALAKSRPVPLSSRLSQDEKSAHSVSLGNLSRKTLWP